LKSDMEHKVVKTGVGDARNNQGDEKKREEEETKRETQRCYNQGKKTGKTNKL